MNGKLRGIAEMSAAMVISGTIGLFVMKAHQPVINVVFWRCAIGAPILFLICAYSGAFRHSQLNPRRLAVAVLGGMAIVTNWLLLFSAYPYVSISIATTVYNTQPFILIGLGALFFGERFTLEKLTWLSIAFLGVVLIAEASPRDLEFAGAYCIGIGLALAAAFFYALAALAARGLKGTPPHLVALIQTSTGVALLAPLADFAHGPAGTFEWSMLMTLGVIHTGVMYILLYGAIQKLPLHLIGALSFIYPVASLVVDRIAFDHRLGSMQIVGVVLVLGAAAGTTLGWGWRRRQSASSPA